MKSITHKTLLLLCLLALAITTFAAPEAEFGKLSKAWTLHADGSQEFRCNTELTLFTHTAMNGTYGESFIVYNPQFQELKIHSSYTKQKDGTIVKTPENAFVEVLPQIAAHAPAYNHLKEMVVVHTGLELGATIYLDYSIVTRPGYYAELDVDCMLEESSPVKEYTVTLSVPEGKPLHFQLYSSPAKAKETTANGIREVRWNLKHVPALSHAPFQPKNKNGIMRVTASTYASQKESLAALNDKLKASVDFESKTFAQYITEKATGDKEKALILRNHVVNHIATSQVGMEQTGYTVRDADAVLRSAYGTLVEKTQLLNTMLNAVGIPSEVVAVYPGTLDVDACGLNAINEIAIQTTIDNQALYISALSLSPTSITARGALDRVYTLAGNEQKVISVPTLLKEKKELTVETTDAANGYAVCTLPASSTGVDTWQVDALNSTRNEWFEIPSCINQEITYTVKLADGMQLQTPVTTTVVRKPFGEVTRTIRQQGDSVEVIRHIKLDKLQYTPAEYKDLRLLLNEWVDSNNRILLLR